MFAMDYFLGTLFPRNFACRKIILILADPLDIFLRVAVPVEMPVINKERLGGYYRLSAHYTAKVTSQSTMVLLLPGLLFTILYWLSGLHYGFLVYLQMLLVLFMSCLISQVS